MKRDKLLILLEKIEELSGKDILVLDLPEDYAVARTIIIVEATSRKHAQGIADKILESEEETGEKILGREGYNLAEWILIDYNDIVIHIMQREARELYNLGNLWGHQAKREQLK